MVLYVARALPEFILRRRRGDQSIRSELLPRLNPRIDNPHNGDPKGNKFQKKDELYQEDQESEIPRIPRVGKIDLCLIPK